MKIIPATPLKPEDEFEIAKFKLQVDSMTEAQVRSVIKDLFTFHINYKHMMEILIRHQWGIEVPQVKG